MFKGCECSSDRILRACLLGKGLGKPEICQLVAIFKIKFNPSEKVYMKFWIFLNPTAFFLEPRTVISLARKTNCLAYYQKASVVTAGRWFQSGH